MTAHEMVKKLDDEALNLAQDCVTAMKRKRRAEETCLESFWVMYHLVHGMLCELANREEAE